LIKYLGLKFWLSDSRAFSPYCILWAKENLAGVYLGVSETQTSSSSKFCQLLLGLVFTIYLAFLTTNAEQTKPLISVVLVFYRTAKHHILSQPFSFISTLAYKLSLNRADRKTLSMPDFLLLEIPSQLPWLQ